MDNTQNFKTNFHWFNCACLVSNKWKNIYSDAFKNIYCVQELQLNILQQTHLMQAGEKVKSSVLLQQLQTKQQQLMGQLQQAQHLLTLNMLIQVTTELSQRNFTKFSHCSEK